MSSQVLRGVSTHRHRRAFRGKAFTLIELLVVIAVIMLLAALTMSVLRGAIRQSERATCMNNLRQWGTALRAYSVANSQYFPDNRDGQHISWVGQTVKKFCTEYLTEIGEFGGADRMRENHIVHCPTQEWHRIYGADYSGPPGTAFSGLGLVGYFYMPHRDVTSANYTYAGNSWVAKRKYSSQPANAPIMSDMKQYADNGLGWYLDGTVPWSSHVGPTGEPYGCNFLFQDGSVRWYDTSVIDLGCTVGSWRCYYKIPLD